MLPRTAYLAIVIGLAYTLATRWLGDSIDDAGNILYSVIFYMVNIRCFGAENNE